MLSLLKAELKTMLKWKATRYTIVFLVLLAFLISGINVLNEEPALSGVFTFPAIVLLIISAIGGLFTYQDYSQNTIRNKIVVGHSRFNVYLSKTIILLALHILLVASFMIIYSSIGLLCLNTEHVIWEAFWKNCLIVLSSTIFVSSLTSMLSINIKSPLGGLLPMIFTSSLLFGGIFGMEILSVNGNEKLIETVQQIPVVSLINCVETVISDNICSTIMIGFVASIIMVVGGYLTFRRADLK